MQEPMTPEQVSSKLVALGVVKESKPDKAALIENKRRRDDLEWRQQLRNIEKEMGL